MTQVKEVLAVCHIPHLSFFPTPFEHGSLYLFMYLCSSRVITRSVLGTSYHGSK